LRRLLGRHPLPLLFRRARLAGREARPRLLRALWSAQQPPGRLSRALPRLQRLLTQTLFTLGLVAVGFAVGRASGHGGAAAGQPQYTADVVEPAAAAGLAAPRICGAEGGAGSGGHHAPRTAVVLGERVARILGAF
jgi:hypothetical protein